MSALAEALSLAAEGRRVVILHPNSKRPIGERWQERATSDPDAIRAGFERVRAANIGTLGGDGLAMVDVDRSKGGFATLAALEAEHGALPATRTVRTGTDGRHFWYATAGDTASWNPGPGLEIRARGRQCVCPPSRHPNGQVYAWLDRRPDLAPLPQWLLRPEPRAARAGTRHDGLADPVLEIPPDVYVPALTGREPDAHGFIVCPLHADTDPSLKVYDDAERGWYCYGCQRGGTVIDLAAALAGIDGPVRGADFLGVLDYLRGRFA